MVDPNPTLEGTWDLRDSSDSNCNASVNTCHYNFYQDMYASHFTKERNCVLSITASNLGGDSISFVYASDHHSSTREFCVDRFNFLYPGISNGGDSNGSSCTLFGSVIALDSSIGACSLLVVGPLPGQRVIEKYTLQEGGTGLTVRYFISSIEVGTSHLNRFVVVVLYSNLHRYMKLCPVLYARREISK